MEKDLKGFKGKVIVTMDTEKINQLGLKFDGVVKEGTNTDELQIDLLIELMERLTTVTLDLVTDLGKELKDEL